MHSIQVTALRCILRNNSSCVIRTRDTEGHAHGYVTLTYKVTRDSWCVELYIFDISDFMNLQNKKKIIALASLVQEIRKTTLIVTWPWRTRSRMIVGVWNCISLTFKTSKTEKDHRTCVNKTRDTKGHAHGHMSLTYKVTRDSWCVALYIFDIPDPENLQNKKRLSLLRH